MKKDDMIILQAMQQIAVAKTATEQYSLIKHAIKLAYVTGIQVERERCAQVAESLKPDLAKLTDFKHAQAMQNAGLCQEIAGKIRGH